MNRLKARMLLDECTGRYIWSVEHCQSRGVPRDWIESLADCFESGFNADCETIYHDHGQGERPTNQYEGILDSDLAFRLAEFLGIDARRAIALAPTPEAEVVALKEAVDE
jgi:hypothetical protein